MDIVETLHTVEETAAILGVTANAQPLWAAHEPQMDELTIPYLGEPRASWQYPYASLARLGATLAFGSDWFVAPPTPIEGIYAAVTRRTLDDKNPDGWFPEQKIGVEDALQVHGQGLVCPLVEEDLPRRPFAAGLHERRRKRREAERERLGRDAGRAVALHAMAPKEREAASDLRLAAELRYRDARAAPLHRAAHGDLHEVIGGREVLVGGGNVIKAGPHERRAPGGANDEKRQCEVEQSHLRE